MEKKNNNSPETLSQAVPLITIYEYARRDCGVSDFRVYQTVHDASTKKPNN